MLPRDVNRVYRWLVSLASFLAVGAFFAAEAAPRVLKVFPEPGQVRALTQVKVAFSQPVSGVNAADLLVGGQPAAVVTMLGNAEIYLFTLDRPLSSGPVQVSWVTPKVRGSPVLWPH